MNTRRIPFQFSTTDPLARQRELEKRFGLQPTYPNMYVDVNNPVSMGTIPKETSSPRLQHRVPIFAEGYDQPIHSSVDSMTSVPDKKPNVRVIPIEVEGVDRSPRHRTYSGPAGILKDRCDSLASERSELSPFKKFNFEDISKPLKKKHSAEPRVYNIPIQVEGATNVSKSPNINASSKPKSVSSVTNKCSQSKLPNKVKSSTKDEVLPESNENKIDQLKTNVEISLKKIEDILTEFKTYEVGVAEFTGTSKDKQYRYLDEMLTRCMLKLDDINTMGNEEIRLSRKNAVKKIQASIDLLESKANPESIAENSQTQSTPEENSIVEKTDDVEMQDSEINNTVDSFENKNLPEKKLNNVTDAEMQEIKDKTSDVDDSPCEGSNLDVDLENRTELVIPGETGVVTHSEENLTLSLQNQQNMPEAEINSDKVNSTSEIQSSTLLETGNTAEQTEVSNKISNDVEMLDEENLISNSVEESLHETEKNETNEVSEVEMQDVILSESSEKSVCVTNEENVDNSNCLEQINDCNIDKNMQIQSVLSPNNTEMKGLPKELDIVHNTGDKCTPDLLDQDTKCAS